MLALSPRVTQCGENGVTVDIPVTDAIPRVGSIVSGQAFATLADTAMVLSAGAHLGRMIPVAIVTLDTQFLRPGSGDAARVEAQVMRAGRSMIFARCTLSAMPGAKPITHATATFAVAGQGRGRCHAQSRLEPCPDLAPTGRMMLRSLFILVLLAGCGRPLTPAEIAFSATIHGDMLDTTRVRLVDGAPTRAVTFRRKARPRTTCRELILPPPADAIVTARPAAVTLWQNVLFDKDWYLDNYVPDYPDQINLIAAMLLTHELTHVWQWQNRAQTGYSPLRAAREHQTGNDPYLFDIGAERQFSEFGYEQQGSIVEEFVCCRALAPQAPRTKRLHALISRAMPVAPLPQTRQYDVRLPWDGVELNGICG